MDILANTKWSVPRNTVQHLTTAPSPYVITVNSLGSRPRCNVISTDPALPSHTEYFASIEQARAYGEAFKPEGAVK